MLEFWQHVSAVKRHDMLVDTKIRKSFNISQHMTFNVPTIVNDMGPHKVHTFIVPRHYSILT